MRIQTAANLYLHVLRATQNLVFLCLSMPMEITRKKSQNSLYCNGKWCFRIGANTTGGAGEYNYDGDMAPSWQRYPTQPYWMGLDKGLARATEMSNRDWVNYEGAGTVWAYYCSYLTFLNFLVFEAFSFVLPIVVWLQLYLQLENSRHTQPIV